MAAHVFNSHFREAAPFELVKACVAAHAISPALHRILNEQVPRLSQTATEAKITALLRDFLKQRDQEIKFQKLELTLFILSRTVESLIEAAINEQSEFLEARQLEREITKLLLSYLVQR